MYPVGTNSISPDIYYPMLYWVKSSIQDSELYNLDDCHVSSKFQHKLMQATGSLHQLEHTKISQKTKILEETNFTYLMSKST